MSSFTIEQGRYPDFFVKSVSGRGGQKGGYLVDVGGSWPETWMTGSFLTSKMMFFLARGKCPEKFMLISQWEVCQEGGVKKGYTLRTWRVPDRRHGWQDHSWSHEWCPFSLRNIPWKFQVNIFICCEVIRVLGVNGQLPRREREERWEREERERDETGSWS